MLSVVEAVWAGVPRGQVGQRLTLLAHVCAESMPELSELERSAPFKVFVCFAYLALNTSLNMLNRWALGQYGFRFPMILTASALSHGLCWERVCTAHATAPRSVASRALCALVFS